jgi:Flp pilus assembly protein TadD
VRSPKEAIALAEHAADLTDHKNASVLDTLGAAYASDGRYEEAAAVARQAFDMASNANSDEATEFLKRLDLYRKGQAYREDAALK